MKTYVAKIAGLLRSNLKIMYQTHSVLFQNDGIDYFKCSKNFKKMIRGGLETPSTRCRTRIRTRTKTTKMSCAAITPYDNRLTSSGRGLFSYQQPVVFLTALKNYITSVHKILLGNDAGVVVSFFLVY